MYFCGWTMEEILEKKLPQKLLEQGINISFELAICNMFELRKNDSAMLVHGYMNSDSSPCAWVEYNNGKGGRIVRNYCSAWREMPYLSFHNKYYPDTERIYLGYIFWTAYTKQLCELTKSPETSYIFNEIAVLRPKFRDGKICNITDFHHHSTSIIDGSKFIPTVIINPDKSVALITQEFLESLMK